MIGAALLAKNAVERGLTSKPWVKTTLAPGLQGRHRLLREGRPHAVPREARLQPGRLRLHHLHRQLRPAARGDLGRGQRGRPRRRLGAVGQPQLRGPDQPRRQDELPGLAAAGRRLRAGRLDGRRPRRPSRSGTGHRRQRRLPAATSGRPPQEVQEVDRLARSPRRCSPRTTPTCSPATSAGSRCRRPRATTFEWDPESTYVRKPPYFDGMPRRARRRSTDIAGARVLAKLGDSVTTDHISPAGAIKADTPAGAVPGRARRRPNATSTPTAPAAATTR